MGTLYFKVPAGQAMVAEDDAVLFRIKHGITFYKIIDRVVSKPHIGSPHSSKYFVSITSLLLIWESWLMKQTSRLKLSDFLAGIPQSLEDFRRMNAGDVPCLSIFLLRL